VYAIFERKREELCIDCSVPTEPVTSHAVSMAVMSLCQLQNACQQHCAFYKPNDSFLTGLHFEGMYANAISLKM